MKRLGEPQKRRSIVDDSRVSTGPEGFRPVGKAKKGFQGVPTQSEGVFAGTPEVRLLNPLKYLLSGF